MLTAAVWRRLASVLVISFFVSTLITPTEVILAADTGALAETEIGDVDTLVTEKAVSYSVSEETNTDKIESIEALESHVEIIEHSDSDNALEAIYDSRSSNYTPAVSTTSETPVPTGPETTPPFAVSTFEVTNGLEFVELYNQGSSPLLIADISFRVSNIYGEFCVTGVGGEGWVIDNEYLYIVSPLSHGSQSEFTQDCELSKDITRLEVFYRQSRTQLIDDIRQSPGHWYASKGTWTSAGMRKKPSAIKQDGSFDKYYWTLKVNPLSSPDSGYSLYNTQPYVPPISSGLKIVELLPKPQSACLPSSIDIECGDYIKILNTSDQDVNLAEFRVRVGARATSASVSNSFNWHDNTLSPVRDELVLKKGEFFVLRYRDDGQRLNLANSSSAVWVEDYIGLQVYDEVIYDGMDKAAATDRSWSYDFESKSWKFGIPNPLTAENIFPDLFEAGKGGGDLSGLKPCNEDQFRHPETNRCRKIASVEEVADCGEGRERNPSTGRCRNIAGSKALTPCREGQYRSEETNRCRSIASAAAGVLKPCRDDQFRNPETNRCKKIASTDELADCGEGRERNPETNRCRNVLAATISDAPFAPERVSHAAQSMLGWWALGGMSLLAVGYAGWQWRFEVGKFAGKVWQVFSSGRGS